MADSRAPESANARSGVPLRVAIVGGGCAAMAAAFELSRPEHAGRFELTVYQMGWRLGGKGASGRGKSGRIEEHGLHVWMGFYENAFRLMRECYQELGRDRFRCPIANWEEAFVPAPAVAVVDRTSADEWASWIAHFPPRPGKPGDGLRDQNPFTVRGYITQALTLVLELVRSTQRRAAGHPGTQRAAGPSLDSPETVVATLEAFLRHGRIVTATALVEGAELLRQSVGLFLATPFAALEGPHGTGAPAIFQGPGSVVLRLFDALATAARQNLEATLAEEASELQRTWQVIDLILACVRGSLAAGLAFDPRGFDALDEYDWRDWLRQNGAARASLDSGFMRGIYDLAFAYEEGDVARPRLSAAVAMRGAMRMFFTYRGALFWKMTAGMGDIVFAPLYEVLRQRGVRFHFFHRLTGVRASSAADSAPAHVAALSFHVQARVKSAEYKPLVPVNGLPCWPSEPDYAQLDGADPDVDYESPWEPARVEKKTLRVGKDFDFVVLGVGGGAVAGLCPELVAHEPKWRAMTENLKFVATQACQVWLNEDMRSLGYDEPAVTLSGWVEPFDTWADMSHLIRAERFRTPVKAIAYFCSPLDMREGGASSDADVRAEKARVFEGAVRFLDQDVPKLWPRARSRSGGFRWELLAADDCPKSVHGSARLATQFWTANVKPSDLYSLSLPGTQRHRISPLDMSFDNLTIAGDWTDNGLNTGCVEAAVMSGLLAAHALSGRPALEEIIGYDHP